MATAGYSSFRKKVIYPSIRIGVSLLAVLAIGFASWLETNESVDSCTFKNSLSFHQVHLYQNISSNLTTPDSVSFGLWKTCYFYSLNCTCSPTNIKYEPDIPNILQIATEHMATPPRATSTSLSRFAPLIVATVFAGLAVVVGFIANSRGQYYLRRIICGFIVIAIALTAYVFGSTFKSYQDSIKSTCKAQNNSIYCTKYAIGVEAPIFGVAIGLLVLSLLFWFFSSGLLKIDEDQEEQQDEDDDLRCCGCFFKSKPEPEPTTTPATKKQRTNSGYIDQYQPPSRPIDELAAWQDADYYNYPEKAYYDQPYYPTPLQQQQNNPHQTKKYSNNNNYSSARGHKSRVTSKSYDMYDQAEQQHRRSKPRKKRSSSQQLDYYQQDGRNSNQHLDYYQQDARGSNHHLDYYQQKSARNSNQHLDSYHRNSNQQLDNPRSSSQHLEYYSPADYFQQQQQEYYQTNHKQQQRSHRKSQDSSLTFGGRRRSSGKPFVDMEPPPRMGGGNKTPTTMSPHPLLNSNENMMRNSYCMTPYYEEGSSGSNSSYMDQHHKKKRSSQNQVPILNMPPAGIEHPLNKKVIKDKRIQEYLHQTTPTNSSNSSY